MQYHLYKQDKYNIIRRLPETELILINAGDLVIIDIIEFCIKGKVFGGKVKEKWTDVWQNLQSDTVKRIKISIFFQKCSNIFLTYPVEDVPL